MKKLLSFLAAGIAALGLASCSGDLHNEFDPTSALGKALFGSSINIADFETFELCGKMTGWANDSDTNIKFVENEDGTWEADFLSTEDDEQGFCFITKTGLWDDYQIGGESMEAGTLPDGVKFSSKAGGGKHEDAILSGLKKKSYYKMTVDASTGVYVVSVETTKPSPFYLVGAFVRGSMNAGSASGDTVLVNPSLDKSTYEVTYTYDFDLASNGDWGQNVDTEVSFGITIGSDWSTKYTGASYAFGTDTDYVATTLGADANNKISGLDKTKAYRLIIKTTPDKSVSFKVIEVAKYSLNIVVAGIPAASNGETAIICGTFNKWPGWTSAWGGSKKVSELPSAVISNGTATFTSVTSGIADLGDNVALSGCGYYGAVTTDDIATASGEIKIGGNDFKIEFNLTGSGTYTATIDLVNDEVTVAKN